MPRFGQDFGVPFSGASSAAHALTFNARVPRLLRRLTIMDGGRGLVTKLAVGGHNYLLGPGFPAAALSPDALTDADNTLEVITGPQNDINLDVSYTVASKLRGFIGCDPVDEAALAAAQPLLDRGEPVGPPTWAWGLGEATVAIGATGSANHYASYIPREARLGRMVVVVYGANVVLGDLDIVSFKIAGEDMLARSGSLDALLLGPTASDEDGLRVNDLVGTRDLVEIAFANANAAAITVQVGFFTK